MTDDPRKKIKDAAHDIDLGLNGLFGALGDAIGDMVSKLEEGNSGAVSRDHVFETKKGPIRAHAGVRLKMGGLGEGSASRSTPEPINPDRSAQKSTPSARVAALEYDLFEDAEAWIFTADLPGVARDELSLSQEGTYLELKTSGPRMFEARVDLEKVFDFEAIETRLHNGVLTLQIPKKAQA